MTKQINNLFINGDSVVVAKLPQQMSITNTSASPRRFVPYRENFMTSLEPGAAINFTVNYASQVLYYLGQATEGLVVTQSKSSAAPAKRIEIELPAKITLTNTNSVKSGVVEGFIPYKENFQVNIAPQKKVELVAETFGQVLYYLAQATTNLKVEQAKVMEAAASVQSAKAPKEQTPDNK